MEQQVQLDQLRDFARFLLDNRLIELTENFLQHVRQESLPNSSLFLNFSEAEVFNYYKGYFENFLISLINDTAPNISNKTENLVYPLLSQPSRISRSQEIYEILAAQKLCMLNFLDQYCGSLSSATQIFIELEKIFQSLQKSLVSEILASEKELNTWLSVLYRSTSLRFYIFDLKLQRLIFINQTGCQFPGLDKDERIINAKEFIDYAHPDDKSLIAKYLQDISAKAESNKSVVKIRIKNAGGNFEWFKIQSFIYKNDANGNPLILLLTAENISEIKESEVAISRVEQVRHEIEKLAKIGYYEWNAKTNKIVWSDEMFRIYGYEPGEIPLSFDYIDTNTVHPDSVGYRNKLMERLFISPGSYPFEHKILKKGGIVGYISGQVISFTDDKNRVTQIIGYAQEITEKHSAEKKLKESEHFNKLITESSPNLIFVYELPTLRWVFQNRSIGSFLCYHNDGKQIPPNNLLSLMHPEDLNHLSDHHRKLAGSADGEIYSIDIRVRDENGNYRWVRSNEAVFKRDETGRAVQIIGNAQDVTQSKQIKQRLRDINTNLEALIQARTFELEASRKQLNLIINGVPALIAYVNKEERYEYVNQAYVNWHKRKSEDFVGKTVKEILGDTAYIKIKDSLRRALSGKSDSFETTLRFAVGRRTVHVTYQPDINENGEVNGIIVLVIDLTLEKQLQEELREREQQLRLIADSIPAPISYIDKTGAFVFANKACIEWTGMGDALIGRNVENVLSEVYKDAEPQIKECLTGKTIVYENKLTLNRITREARIQYIPNISEGEVLGYFCLIIDITEDKRKEQVLKKQNEELLRINNDLDNFIYTASHDLKAPVSNIEGLVYTLSDALNEKYDLDQDHKLIIQLIKDSILRFQKTIADLTEITKTQRNIQEDIEIVDLKEVLEEVKWSLNHLIIQSGAIIETEFKKVKGVRFSRKNIRSVMHNLISNSIKYRVPDRVPVVKITMLKKNGSVFIEVADNGLGIPEDQQDKIFKMFKRLHDHVDGSGIGLYIVKRIVENANGRIWVESQENKGSRFIIEIPAPVED